MHVEGWGKQIFINAQIEQITVFLYAHAQLLITQRISIYIYYIYSDVHILALTWLGPKVFRDSIRFCISWKLSRRWVDAFIHSFIQWHRIGSKNNKGNTSIWATTTGVTILLLGMEHMKAARRTHSDRGKKTTHPQPFNAFLCRIPCARIGQLYSCEKSVIYISINQRYDVHICLHKMCLLYTYKIYINQNYLKNLTLLVLLAIFFYSHIHR